MVTDINTSEKTTIPTQKSVLNKSDEKVSNNNQNIRKTINNKKPKQKEETNNKTNRQFVCDFIGCGKQFKSKFYLWKHRTIHCETFVCDFIGCGFKTRRAVGFRDHLNVHNGVKPHKCNFCDEEFSSESSRKKHQANYHYSEMNMGESYKCQVEGCGREFNDSFGKCFGY